MEIRRIAGTSARARKLARLMTELELETEIRVCGNWRVTGVSRASGELAFFGSAGEPVTFTTRGIPRYTDHEGKTHSLTTMRWAGAAEGYFTVIGRETRG